MSAKFNSEIAVIGIDIGKSRERPGGHAAEQCHEIAPFHCPMPPVLPNTSARQTAASILLGGTRWHCVITTNGDSCAAGG